MERYANSIEVGNTFLIERYLIAIARWIHESNCNPNPDGNAFFNDTICADMIAKIPPCLDNVQHAYEQPTIENKLEAFLSCITLSPWNLADRNPYDWRQKVFYSG